MEIIALCVFVGWIYDTDVREDGAEHNERVQAMMILIWLCKCRVINVDICL